MKDKILTLIIGILIGAILTTAGFLIYEKYLNSQVTKQTNGEKMNEEMPPEKPNGEEPPEMWDMEEPPAKPDEN